TAVAAVSAGSNRIAKTRFMGRLPSGVSRLRGRVKRFRYYAVRQVLAPGPSAWSADGVFHEMMDEPLAALTPHLLGDRVACFRLREELQAVGIVPVTRQEILDELLDRFDVNLVTGPVGQEQGFRGDGRLPGLRIQGANELADPQAQAVPPGVLGGPPRRLGD